MTSMLWSQEAWIFNTFFSCWIIFCDISGRALTTHFSPCYVQHLLIQACSLNMFGTIGLMFLSKMLFLICSNAPIIGCKNQYSHSRYLNAYLSFKPPFDNCGNPGFFQNKCDTTIANSTQQNRKSISFCERLGSQAKRD